MLLYALDRDHGLADALAAALGEPLAAHEERLFDDGEGKWRPLTDPRGADCVLVAPLHGGPRLSPHDRLCRMLFMAGALRDHGAARVTALVPYLAYARKDRQTKPFDPLTLRYVAQLMEAVGIAQLIVLEAHNPAALQNAFRVPTMHLSAHALFDAPAARLAGTQRLVVASPDPGGVKRAQLWRESLAERVGEPPGFAMVDKRRSGGVLSSESLVAGGVQDTTVLLLDDLIASGETLRGAARALRSAGAQRVIACAAHGLFVGDAARVLDDPVLDEVWISDSVPAFRLAADAPLRRKLHIVPSLPLFSEALAAARRAA